MCLPETSVRASGAASVTAARAAAAETARSIPREEVALVASARRELLLRVHRFRLRREDLEDCYSQATLELVLRARRGGGFADRAAPRQRARAAIPVADPRRRRALSGRSPMQAALEGASSLGALGRGAVEIVDMRAEVEQLVILRHELRRIGAARAPS